MPPPNSSWSPTEGIQLVITVGIATLSWDVIDSVKIPKTRSPMLRDAPDSDSPSVVTYIESDADVDLEPATRAKLLFAAWLSHGPGFMEGMRFYAGSTKCKEYDVLWQSSDWCDDTDKLALAWVARGTLTGPALWEELLLAYWKAEKTTNSWASPFSGIIKDKKSALTSEEVWKIADQVWPAE